MEIRAFFQVILLFCYLSAKGQEVVILPNGHSHNDYTRERPLLDALQYGFTSIEADVYLFEGRMVVSHNDKDLSEKPTLEELYLDPLRKIIHQNGGTVYKDDTTQLVLMIDLKSDKRSTVVALRQTMQRYTDLIEWHKKGLKIHGPIKVLLSGGPPLDMLRQSDTWFFYADGSPEQWSGDYPVSLMPRASANYRSYFKWYGKGPMPADEEATLRSLIAKAHTAGRKVRFWGCPNRKEVWQKLLDEGADWINVDDLKGYSDFYKSYRKRLGAQ